MRSKRMFTQEVILESERILLRQIRMEDLEDLFLLYSNEKIYKYRPGVIKKTKESVEKFIQNSLKEYEAREALYFAICLKEHPERVIGVAELFGIDKMVEMVNIGYSINEDYWNQGIATEVAGILIRYLFEEIEVNRIQAHVMPENKPSERVLLKNGMSREGLIRQGAMWNGKGIVDVNQFSYIKEDYLNLKNA